MLETLWHDLRYGMRMLWKSPGISAVAILALALGIGANSAVFSVVNAVLLRQLPYQEPQRLAMVWETNPEGQRLGFNQIPASSANFVDWRDQNQVFEQVAALDSWIVNLTGGDLPEGLSGARVSASLFPLLRVNPILGRNFLPEEDRPGGNHVVMLSHGLWQHRFGSDRGLVGKSLTLNGESYTVVGVMPADFNFPQDAGMPSYFTFARKTDIWTPLALTDAEVTNRRSHYLAVIGRLKPGVTVERAQAEMGTLASRLAQQYPDFNDGWGTTVIALHEQVVGKSRQALWILLGVVGCVLLIACANVANLLLARAVTRRKEFAMRTALGAGRRRLIRQLLTESFLLSLIGGVLGVLLALLGVKLLVALSPGDLPRVGEINVDGRVLGFTLLLSLLTGLIFGIAPALQASKSDPSEALKEGSRALTGGRQRLRALLVVSEIAISLVLLIGTGLLIKSFRLLQKVEPGFNPQNVLTMEVILPEDQYKDDRRVTAFFQQITERIQTIPGVQAVGAVNTIPLSGTERLSGFAIQGRPAPTDADVQQANLRIVTPGYFRAMGIPVVRGRGFSETDGAEAAAVAVIDESMAQRFFPGEDPIGKQLKEGDASAPNPWRTIVGIVGSIKHTSLDSTPTPHLYLPHLQKSWTYMNLAVRSATSNPTGLVSAIRREVAAVDKMQPVSNVETMEQVVSRSLARQRFTVMLLGPFAGVALLLAATGIYGVLAYSVTQRTNEIGIRMALGARRADIIRLIVGQALLLTSFGLLTGLVIAFALTRILSSMLYEVSTTDLATFVSVPLLLAAVALAACYVPARRATKVDPLVALRQQ